MSSILRILNRLKLHWPVLVTLLILIPITIWIAPKYVRMQDEGMLASAAMQVASGKILYKDVFEFWTPLSVYLTASVFSLFGITVTALRGLFVVLALLNTLAFYYIIRHIFPHQLLQLMSLIVFAFISFGFVGMNHHWLGMLFLLLTICLLEKTIQTRRWEWAGLSGLSASMTFLAMQLEGAIAILLCIVALSMWFRLRSELKIWISMVTCGLIPVLVVLVYFATQGALTQLATDTLWFPLNQYREVNGVFADATQVLQTLILLVVAGRWLNGFPSTTARLWLYATLLWQVFFLVSSNTVIATRFSFFYVTVLLGLIGMVGSIARSQNWRLTINESEFPRHIFKFYILSTLLIVSCAGLLLESITSWRNIYLANQEIVTSAGTMYARPEVASKAQTILDYVNLPENKQKKVYFGPFSAHYHFLSQRENPIRYSQLTPKYNTEAMMDNAVSELKQTQVQIIVFLPQENPFAFGDNNALSRYIENAYQPVVNLPFTTLLSSKMVFSGSYKRQQTNRPYDAIWKIKE